MNGNIKVQEIIKTKTRIYIINHIQIEVQEILVLSLVCTICTKNFQSSQQCKEDQNSKYSNSPQSLRFTPTRCTSTLDVILLWKNFDNFYTLISSIEPLETYALEIYKLSSFLKHSFALKKYKGIPLVGPRCKLQLLGNQG